MTTLTFPSKDAEEQFYAKIKIMDDEKAKEKHNREYLIKTLQEAKKRYEKRIQLERLNTEIKIEDYDYQMDKDTELSLINQEL